MPAIENMITSPIRLPPMIVQRISAVSRRFGTSEYVQKWERTVVFLPKVVAVYLHLHD